MADTADSPSNRHSAGATAVSGDISSNHQFLPSNVPWARVVLGELESVSLSSSTSLATEQTSLTDCCPSQTAHSPPPIPLGNFATCDTSDASSVIAAAQTKNPVWNKPSNSIIEVGPVMGAVSWPALSDSIKSSSKLQSESSSKPAVDGSNSTPQGPANPPIHQQHTTSNEKPNSTSNHTMPVRQKDKSKNRSSIGRGPTRGGFVRPFQAPPPPPFPVYPMSPNSYGYLVLPMADTSLHNPSLLNYNWATRPVGGFISQHHQVRGNINPHMVGDGLYHNSWGRPDHDHGPHARDVHMQQQRPHPGSHLSTYRVPTHFLAPERARAFGNPVDYQQLVYFQTRPLDPLPEPVPLEQNGGPQLMSHPPIVQSSTDPPLSTLLVKQIDYYFCDANLGKDKFLKSHMDDEGWVSIDIIANFPRVKRLTEDIHLIKDSLKSSAIVEIKDYKVRRRNDWIKWRSNMDQTAANSLSSESSQNTISFKNLKIGEVGGSHTSTNDYTDSTGKLGKIPERGPKNDQF